VETRAQVDRLRALDCDTAQGWYFARPMPADQVTQLIAGSSAGKTSSRASVSGGKTSSRSSGPGGKTSSRASGPGGKTSSRPAANS
jgi:predicted signal transduction protein with EAL and GGDEF domain